MGSGYPSDWGRRRKRVYKRDNYTCQECGRRGGKKGNTELHAHHIVPKSKGGSHKLKNLTTLCKDCHAEAHTWMGSTNHRPQSRFWGWMHKKADSELNEFYEGCPNCGEADLKVRWERLKFRKKAKVLQCSSCGAMYDERIKQEEAVDRLELVRVSDVEQIQAASSARKQERKRFAIREKMQERLRAQKTFGACPSCGEGKNMRINSGILTEKFHCKVCSAELERRRLGSEWEMTSGVDELTGRSMSPLDWEQIAVDRTDDSPESELEANETSTNQIILEKDKNSHTIPEDTWRGRVAKVLEKNEWMDAGDVSQAMTNSSSINYTISSGGASSVLSDMYRNNDVVRREVSSGRTKYEYRLRENAVLD